jgi:hypothetical protein
MGSSTTLLDPQGTGCGPNGASHDCRRFLTRTSGCGWSSAAGSGTLPREVGQTPAPGRSPDCWATRVERERPRALRRKDHANGVGHGRHVGAYSAEVISAGGEHMPDDDEEVTPGVSRRSALKKIGAGAAIAWSAPVIMSAGSRAFAAGSAAPLSCVCEPHSTGCQDHPGCGTSPDAATCYCAPLDSGGCSCVKFEGASLYQRCNTSPCPTGYVCLVGTCGSFGPYCAPLCSVPV